jgi:hypothetical protein
MHSCITDFTFSMHTAVKGGSIHVVSGEIRPSRGGCFVRRMCTKVPILHVPSLSAFDQSLIRRIKTSTESLWTWLGKLGMLSLRSMMDTEKQDTIVPIMPRRSCHRHLPNLRVKNESRGTPNNSRQTAARASKLGTRKCGLYWVSLILNPVASVLFRKQTKLCTTNVWLVFLCAL